MAAKAAKVDKVMEVVEPVVEETIEVIETVERIPRLRLNGTTKKQQLLILGVTAGVSAAVTGAIVWKVVQKRAELKYERIIEQEIAETKAFYQQINKPWPAVTPEEEAEADQVITEAAQAMRNYQGEEPDVRKQVPEVVTSNIFVEGKPMVADAFDYDAEMANRSIDVPYVISQEEFLQGEKEYVQSSLRWYDGDDILVDDKNVPIDEVDMTVGDCVHKFGHGSKDPRIVYVRNERMEVDFEVVKDDNSYASVIGFKHSARHAEPRRTRRMRDDEG